MSEKNPIKFLDSYTREDKDIFFGREKDTARLYEKVNQSTIVLLYGLSGTGKTSLIHCGLENRFEEYQHLFIYVRRGNHLVDSLKKTISAHASSLIHPHAIMAERLETLFYDYLKPITIIFDQFEELFISGSFDEKKEFIFAVDEILQSGLKVKLIFSLREEYLAHMDEFEEKIPSIYDHRHRLEKMRRGTLEEVITKITEKGKVTVEDETIPGMIIDNISDRKGNVELPYLQVYLDKLTRLGDKSKSKKVFTKKLVEQAGELEDVLADFLEEQISRIADLTGNKEDINTVLKQLITPDGTKRQLKFAEFALNNELKEHELSVILKELELSRLIKLEDEIYELSHDSLAQKIAEKRTAEEIQLIEVIKFIRNAYNSFRQTETLLDRKQLNFIRPYLGQLQLSDDEQRLVELSRNKIRRKNIANWISLLFVMIVLLAAGFYWQYSKFTSFKQKADEYMDEAMYTEAKIEYNRALNVPVPFKQAAVDSSAKCDYYLGLKPKYDSLIAEGNAFFSLGINNYQNAFDRYNSAYNLHYNTEGIEEIISGKKEDALIKYSELANLEAAEGHVDIALAHLARANALEKSTTIQKQFLSLISKLNTDQVREAARKLKVEEDLVPLVLELINDAQNADGNENALRLLRNTLTT